MADDREGMKVTDRGAEVSLRLNNVLTALILGVMSWVGISINDLKTEVGKQNTTITVNTVEIAHNREMILTHTGQITNMRIDIEDLKRKQ